MTRLLRLLLPWGVLWRRTRALTSRGWILFIIIWTMLTMIGM